MQPSFVRCPSSSLVKLVPIEEALAAERSNLAVEVVPVPVELQEREDMDVPAYPKGIKQTVALAKTRQEEMNRQDLTSTVLDVSVESGGVWAWIIGRLWGYWDVAVVFLKTVTGETQTVVSVPVRIPGWAWREAKYRGIKTSPGEVIHERFPEIPANNWQAYSRSLCRGDAVPVEQGISRQDQIKGAVRKGLKRLMTF